jgi:hypothetical protein
MSVHTDRPLDHYYYCGVCRYALERFRVAGQPDRFEHTHSAEGWTGPAHAPLPVPLAELVTVNMVCDVCSDKDPAWLYRFISMGYWSQRGLEDMGGWWAICSRCSVAVEAHDVAALVSRAEIPFVAKDTSMLGLATLLGPLYVEILAHPFERTPAREVRSGH